MKTSTILCFSDQKTEFKFNTNTFPPFYQNIIRMNEVRKHFYAIFEVSIPTTMNRKTRKKLVYEAIGTIIAGSTELDEEFTNWVDTQTMLFQQEYSQETVALLEADIAENKHDLNVIVFQAGIVPGDIIRRTSDVKEEEEEEKGFIFLENDRPFVAAFDKILHLDGPPVPHPPQRNDQSKRQYDTCDNCPHPKKNHLTFNIIHRTRLLIHM